jgi:phosphoserine phosphatase
MQLVCFDVDSTFCTDESIDELAAFIGKGEQVAELTKQAMEGCMPFQDALKARLDCMNVSKQDLECFLEEHPAQLSPGELPLVTKSQHHRY